MRYDQKDILDALKECKIKNKVGFVGILPSFTFDRMSKEVVSYTIGPKEGVNDLYVYETHLITIENDLIDYFKQLDLNKSDILVFCINNEYIPKDNQIRLCIISIG